MAQQINLFTPVFLKQKKQFSAVALVQGLGLLAAGIVCFFGFLSYRVQQFEANLASAVVLADRQREELLRMGKDFSSQGRTRLLEESAVRAEAQLKARQELLAAMGQQGLGNTDGFSRYLTAFARRAVSGVWLTGFHIEGDDNELALEGRVLHADLVPAYLRELSKEEAMRGRQVTTLKLVARESASAAEAKPAAKAPEAAPAVNRGPSRFVEFSVVAARRIAPTQSPGAADASPAAQKGGS